MSDTTAKNNLTGIAIFGWGLGSLGLSVVLNTLNVLLMAFLTLVVGINPALAGSLILLTKLYDVLTDLPMGWITDRTRSIMGARRPYLLAAGIITPPAIAMLFSTPAVDGTGASVDWAVAAMILYATGYTLFNVPYLSMPAEMSPSAKLRTKMVALRSAFIAGGTFFGVAFAPYLVGSLGGGAEAYGTLGMVMAVVVALGFLGCFALTGGYTPARTDATMPFDQQIKSMIKVKPFVALMAIKVTHLLALSVGMGTQLFFFKYALGYDLQTLGLYGAVTTAAWAISMPFWTKLANGKGKRFGYMIATGAYTVMTLSWLLASSGEPMALMMVRAVLFGTISGGMLLMGNAMLQDVMDHDFRESGVRKNGMFAGLYSLTEKITSGIGAQILGLILATTGFDRAATMQSAEAITGIYTTAAVIPAMLMLISMLAIKAYRLDESKLT